MQLRWLWVCVIGCSTPNPNPNPNPPNPTASVAATPHDAAPVTVAPPPSGPKIVVEWGGPGGIGTASRFRVDVTGAVTDEFFDARGTTKRVGRVTTADLHALAAVHVSHHLCALQADPKYVPVPEERTTTLNVDLPGVACSVELHTNEWGDHPDSKAIEAAVEALMVRANLK